jgi:hypothetical protein
MLLLQKKGRQYHKEDKYIYKKLTERTLHFLDHMRHRGTRNITAQDATNHQMRWTTRRTGGLKVLGQ